MKPNIQCQSPKFECKVLTEFNGNENVVLDSSDVKLFAIPNEAEHISFMIQNRLEKPLIVAILNCHQLEKVLAIPLQFLKF